MSAPGTSWRARLATWFAAACLLLAALHPATALPRQEAGETAGALTGRVQDQEGRPVPDWPVSLHRLNEDGSGAELASTVTNADGVFTFEADFTRDGIYFVATRYDNTIYVGAPFRAPGLPPEVEYVVAVGDPSMGLPLAGPLPEEMMGPPEELPLAGIGLFAFAIAAFIAAAWRGGLRGDWRLAAIRLAELEEAYAAQADQMPAHERELYERRRAELWERLRRRAGVR